MFRKTLIALIAAVTFGATPTAFAGERDGDGNPVPSASVVQPATGWEQAYAGPRQLHGISAVQKAMADRLSVVH